VPASRKLVVAGTQFGGHAARRALARARRR
jgi:hypothetical protein